MPAPLDTAQTCALLTLLRIATKPICSRPAYLSYMLLRAGLVGVLNDDAVILTDVVFVLRHAVDFDIGRADEGHDVEAANLDPLQVGLVGLLELHGDVGLETQHVGRTHLAFQIDKKTRIHALEFDQPGRDPKRAQSLGDRKSNLAAERRCRSTERAVETEGSLFHPLCGLENLRPFRRQPDAVDVAGHQGGLVARPQAAKCACARNSRRRSAQWPRPGSCRFGPPPGKSEPNPSPLFVPIGCARWCAPLRSGECIQVPSFATSSYSWQKLAKSTTSRERVMTALDLDFVRKAAQEERPHRDRRVPWTR